MYNNPSYPLVIAHRGFSGIAPENTIAAIKLAMERGVDMIEIDVHQSKDGVPVVIHDKTIDRTTNGTGRVAAHTYSQLNSFDAGSWFDTAYKEEHIPSLEEVLELIAGTCKLLIEIKHGSSIYGEIEKKVIETVHLKNAQDWCILQSFEDEVLENLKNLNCPLETHKLITADVPILPLFLDTKLRIGSVFKYANIAAINMSSKFARSETITNLHKNGFKVFVWTVNSKTEMQKMIDLKVDGIITNYPDRLLELINR